MILSLVIDMNLSPDWVEALASHAIKSRHWSTIGDPRADDGDILQWALQNGAVVFTHDLDFGTLLAATRASGPSVVQLRSNDVLPDTMLPVVIIALSQFEAELTTGALLTIDVARARVRVLPI